MGNAGLKHALRVLMAAGSHSAQPLPGFGRFRVHSARPFCYHCHHENGASVAHRLRFGYSACHSVHDADRNAHSFPHAHGRGHCDRKADSYAYT